MNITTKLPRGKQRQISLLTQAIAENDAVKMSRIALSDTTAITDEAERNEILRRTGQVLVYAYHGNPAYLREYLQQLRATAGQAPTPPGPLRSTASQAPE